MAGWISVFEILICIGASLYLYSQLSPFRRRRVIVAIPVVLVWSLAALTVFLIPHDIQTTTYYECVHSEQNISGRLDDSLSLSQATPSPSPTSLPTPFPSPLLPSPSPFLSPTPSPTPTPIPTPSPSPSPPLSNCTKPALMLPRGEVRGEWEAVYWVSFVCAYLVFPFMSSYVDAPDMDVKSKLKRVLKENLILYSIILVAGAIGIIVLVATSSLSISRLLGIAMVLSNIVSTTILMVFMGYGVCHVPRVVWRRGDLELTLNYYRFQTVDMHSNMDSEAEAMKEVLCKVKALDKRMERRQPLRREARALVEKVERTKWKEAYAGLKESDWKEYERDFESVTKDDLVTLNGEINTHLYRSERAKVLYDKHLESAFYFQTLTEGDVEELMRDGSIWWNVFPNRKEEIGRFYLSFYSKVQPILFRILAIILVLISVAIGWSELMIWSQKYDSVPDLSLVSLLLKGQGLSPLGQLVLILGVYLYMCVCTFYGLFRIKVFELYRIAWHQQTDARSLLFCAKWTSQLAAMLAYNFLVLSHFEENTSFQQVLNVMDVIPVIGHGFAFYIPILFLFVAIFTSFEVFDRILLSFGIARFQFKDDFSEDQIALGQQRLKRERVRRDRENPKSEVVVDVGASQDATPRDEDLFTPDELKYIQSAPSAKAVENRKKLILFKKGKSPTRPPEVSEATPLSSAPPSPVTTHSIPPFPSTPASQSSYRMSNFYDTPKNPFGGDVGSGTGSNPFADAFSSPAPSSYSSSSSSNPFDGSDYQRSSPYRDAPSPSSPFREPSYQSLPKKETTGNPFADAPPPKPFSSNVDSSSMERQQSRNVLSEHIAESSASKSDKFKGTLKSAFRPLSEMFQKSDSPKKDEGSALMYDDRSYLYGDDDAPSSSSSSSSSRLSFLPNPFARFSSKSGSNATDTYRFESDDESQ